MSRAVRKAVIPVAGFGTRVLPATKVIPKELLPVYDRPALQYVVDEAIAAGIEHFIFITGRNKGAIEDYFDHAFELEAALAQKNKTALLDTLDALRPEAGACSFVRQQAPKGLGHAIWCARDLVGDDPFAVMLPDMIMDGAKPCLKGMVDAYADTGGNMVSVEAVPHEDVSKYGVIEPGEDKGVLLEMTGMVEKPPVDQAPSNLMLSGRYILEPQIMDLLGAQAPGAGGEIQLTDSMVTLLKSRPFHAYKFDGVTYDTGSPQGYLEAFAAMALKADETASTALLSGLLNGERRV
ncbi:MAG: UTP--glucose-1-phosphate uridylyltransferase [Oceanicaulis sp.]|jgi:UTP--glucose-1-phosphate uridylyltransferase|uniref:UTP--glucose-1-phosphate uridylyltransferase GalU n=1 Tax=Oceanicaulis sp. UBA2681 TaxID=1947007 RepID=UPI000C092D4D|nr:UTP--glucose-1-phosphate uridylyltransferase GalU [Oceanicaulis sp. UBA2681]MAP48621.1 UTP--glucose-1-phosphate uridylyltransferase [Oceanicaulis sp.]MBL4537440.1 UTP--glucose-1-phosphate uridylyltransferase GalU [Oceanicaulis sp.]HCR66873.1 UTP--glucose-1-phosphate uridylyltransferase [Oceanicaulis sp.]|tara:strand:+ start:738 stop:1619 length:882 start_codon:yes stop_codon:yes gene_type:complete